MEELNALSALGFAFAPPFGSAVDIESKVSHARGEHHGGFSAGAAEEDNCPDGKIKRVVDEPDPPGFGVAHGHQDNTAEVDAVGSCVKPTQTLAWDEAEEITDDQTASNTTGHHDDGCFECELATFDLAGSVRVFAPLPETPE